MAPSTKKPRHTTAQKVGQILAGLQQPTVGQVEEATERLARLDRAAVLEALLGYLRDPQADFLLPVHFLSCLGDQRLLEPLRRLVFEGHLDDIRVSQLLGLLAEWGVDVTSPEWWGAIRDPELLARQAEERFIDILDRQDLPGFEHALTLLGEMPREARLLFLQGVLQHPAEGIAFLGGVLLDSDDRSLVRSVVESLGKRRDVVAAGLLQQFVERTEDALLRTRAQQLLKHLPRPRAPAPWPPALLLPFRQARSSVIDGNGSRQLIVVRGRGDEAMALCLLLNERIGIKDAFGMPVPAGGLGRLLDVPRDLDVEFYRIEEAYARELVRDALAIREQGGCSLPATFHLYKHLLLAEEPLAPQAYEPAFPDWDLEELRSDRSLLEMTADLAFLPACSSWYVYTHRTFDLAEQVLGRLKRYLPGPMALPDRLVRQAVKEALLPELPGLRRRLLLTADLLQQARRPPAGKRDLIPVLLCAAVTLDRRPEQHPFLQGLAIQSLIQAQQALLLGVDYREDPDTFQERLEEADSGLPWFE